MQKFENVAKVGDRIKALDFSVRDDSYVIGKVIDKGMLTSIQGPRFMAFEILCEESKLGGKEDKSRVGQSVLIPMEVDFMEHNDRIVRV